MSIVRKRFLFGFMESQAKWLNSMSDKGYRLTECGKLNYRFEECEPAKYRYAVEYIGDRSFEEAEKYREFLESFGYRVFYKNMNLDFATYKLTFRPWADKGGRLSSNRPDSTYNKELLIVEKKDDGKPFRLHTESDDMIGYYRRLCHPWYYSAFIFALFAVLLWPNLICSVIFGLLTLLCIASIIAWNFRIRRLVKDRETEE